ncbi:MAG: site-2 protease family protein [Candidatus Woesearchaeota archaeon]
MVSVDTAATISLIAVLALIVFVNRHKLSFHRWGIFYAAMYRTQTGIITMDKLARKYRRIWEITTPWIIALGFIGMALVTFDLARSLIQILAGSATPTVGVVLPFKAKGVFYVPFFYWIISIFAILIIHEGMHGVMARAYGLKVKNSGLVVLGALIPLIPGAFVEPDEKKLMQAPRKKQLAVYAAGPVANIATGLLLMALMFTVITPLTDTFYSKDGVVVTELMDGNPPAQQAGIEVGDKITEINGQAIRETADFSNALKDSLPGDTINIITSNAIYDIELAENPSNKKAWLGVYVDQPLKSPTWAAYTVLWLKDLIFWMYLLSLGVGLFNLIPLGPVDGGRMFLTALQSIVHEKHASTVWKSVSFAVLAVLITNVVLAFI